MIFKKPVALFVLLVALVAVAPPGYADEDKKWLLLADNSVSLLSGTGFSLIGDNVSVVTVEHFSNWKWGDMFLFVDFARLHNNPDRRNNWYGEFSPRLSLSKFAGLRLPKDGFVRDVLISTTLERGKGGVESLLLGGAVDLNMPGFQVFKINLYARKGTSRGAGFNDMQWTFVWAIPFENGNQKFHFAGGIDYVHGWGPEAPNFHTATQLKWDLGHRLGLNRKIYIGTEIDIWQNRVGIKDTPARNSNQFAVSALLKVHF